MRPVKKTSDFKPDDETTVGNKTAISALEQEKIEPLRKTKTTFNTDELLNYLVKMTEENDGETDWEGTGKEDKETIKYLIDPVFTNYTNKYGLARGPLLNDLGQFCSYCEMRVNDSSLAIEHKLPKSLFPGEMMTYDNFLLACVPCNSSNKKANPTYEEGKEWSEEEEPDYQDVKEAADGHFWWPDDNNDEVYTKFEQKLCKASGDTFSMKDATSTTNTINKIKDGKIQASINGVLCENVKTIINGLDDRAKAMVELVGMNKSIEEEKMGDRRMLNRTIAWLQAVQSFDLNNQVAKLPDNTPNKAALVEAALKQLLSVAADSGFYSVWATVLKYLSADIFFKKFKTATNEDNIYYPGTNQLHVK